MLLQFGAKVDVTDFVRALLPLVERASLHEPTDRRTDSMNE